MDHILWATIGGGIGGALGGLIGIVVGRFLPQKWRAGVTTGIAVAAGLICSRVAVMYAPPILSASSSIEAELLNDPQAGLLMHAWKNAEPGSFQAMVTHVSGMAQAGQNRDAIVSAARADLIAAANPRFVHLDDAHMREMMALAGTEFRELGRSHPVTCKPMFLGASFGDITPYISPGSARRESSLMEAAFHVDMSTTQAVLTGDAFQREVVALMTNTRVKVGDDASLLANGADISGREARYCEVVAALYDQMLALPPADGAALMRGVRAAN